MNKKFKDLGSYYGYPVCCIDSFLNYTKKPTRKLQGTGYIPCENCNVKYTEKELISNINKNRNKTLELFKGN